MVSFSSRSTFLSPLLTVLLPASEDDPPNQVTSVAPAADSEAQIYRQGVYLRGDSEMHQSGVEK